MLTSFVIDVSIFVLLDALAQLHVKSTMHNPKSVRPAVAQNIMNCFMT